LNEREKFAAGGNSAGANQAFGDTQPAGPDRRGPFASRRTVASRLF
jgi:hypothetical protein